MPNYALLTTSGPDRPGIVAAVTGVLLDCDCNIEDSQMSRLGPDFACMLMIRMPEGMVSQQLEERLASHVTELGLRLHAQDLRPEEASEPHVESPLPQQPKRLPTSLVAGRLVAWLYPERWKEAVPAMLALTFAVAAAGLNSHPGLVWIALGRMRLRLWWSLANLALLAVVLTIGATLGGTEGVAYGLAVRSLLATVVAQVITREVARVRHLAYLRALLPGIALWLLLMAIAWLRGR